ncbi:NAD(P)/FAD-dependent oxidoreductase [Kitasatospora sp. NPDC096204]|uniref:NAD(P)/FAD-dependent oxidoreductase n=1 Tax=Kitasatospora sp. NPDC096204 TaxID=3364094 RepID=UPI0037F27651
MARRVVDVIVVGAGVVGRSVAFALASGRPGLRVVLSGRRGPGASEAAGAMLGALGEVTEASLSRRHGRLRVELALEAARRWPRWRSTVRKAGAAGARPDDDGYAAGTFVLLNAVSSPLDERSFAAIVRAGREYGVAVKEIEPADVPAVRPLDNERPLRALHLPEEAFLDARRWLASLDGALGSLPNVTRTAAAPLRSDGSGYVLSTRDGSITAPAVVVAAGAWTSPLVEALDPELTLLPVAAAEGTAVSVSAPAPLPAVLRTPNRAYACGLHAVPQADGSWYLGASAAPALAPGDSPQLGAVRFLLEAALGQLHHGLATARLRHLHFGNRPIGLDGHPLIGATGRPGLWVATGTHRDGLHASPLIAQELAREIVDGTPSPWLAPWRPDRAPISDWTAQEAIAEAAAHHQALAAEARMRPPLTGAWPQSLAAAYHRQLTDAYELLPDGFVLPPELAPLAYEQAPALAGTIHTYLQRRR